MNTLKKNYVNDLKIKDFFYFLFISKLNYSVENGNHTISSPLSTLNNQIEDNKGNRNKGFSFKSIEANSINIDNYPLYDDYRENDKKSHDYYTNNYKSGYNANAFVEKTKNQENYNTDFSHKFSSKEDTSLEIKNKSIESPYKINYNNDYSFQKDSFIDKDKEKKLKERIIEKYKNEINSLQKNIEYIEKKLCK